MRTRKQRKTKKKEKQEEQEEEEEEGGGVKGSRHHEGTWNKYVSFINPNPGLLALYCLFKIMQWSATLGTIHLQRLKRES